MKALVWIYVDCRASVRFFSSKSKAELYASHDNPKFYQYIYCKEFVFDEDGNPTGDWIDERHYKDEKD